MKGISKLIIDLSNLKMFESIESLDYNPISKDHIGEIQVIFQGEKIQESVYTSDDEFTISKRIIKQASLKQEKNCSQHRTKLIACFLLTYENPRGFSLSVII